MVSAAPDPASATPLPRFLPTLLLCLTLIASAVGSAWVATAMAMPVITDRVAEHPCHDTMPGLHDDGSHEHPGPMAGCGDGSPCDCPQQGTALLPILLPLLADLPHRGVPLPAHAGIPSLAPDRLIRPPIV